MKQAHLSPVLQTICRLLDFNQNSELIWKQTGLEKACLVMMLPSPFHPWEMILIYIDLHLTIWLLRFRGLQYESGLLFDLFWKPARFAYLIVDTNLLIDAENGRFELNILDSFSGYGDAYIAAITVSELPTGVHLAKTAEIRIRRSAFVEGIIANIPVLEFNEEVARCHGELYAHFLALVLRPRAKTNVHDLQIAATCITHGFPLLTSNVDDFKKVPGLKIIHPAHFKQDWIQQEPHNQ